MSSPATSGQTRVNPLPGMQACGAWLTRCTKPAGWAMATDPLVDEASPDQFEALSDEATFGELALYAKSVGRTLSKGRCGFILTRGNSSMHFADVHTAREILKMLRAGGEFLAIK